MAEGVGDIYGVDRPRTVAGGGHVSKDLAPVQIWNFRDRGCPSPSNEGIWYMASLEGRNDAWVALHISTADKALTKEVFDALEAERESIEAAIDSRGRPGVALAQT